MINNIWSIVAALLINAILTAYSIKSYKYLLGISWDKFVKRLGITIGIKFLLLFLLTLGSSLIVDIANIYFVLSFSIFMIIQIALEISFLIKMSKKLKNNQN